MDDPRAWTTVCVGVEGALGGRGWGKWDNCNSITNKKFKNKTKGHFFLYPKNIQTEAKPLVIPLFHIYSALSMSSKTPSTDDLPVLSTEQSLRQMIGSSCEAYFVSRIFVASTFSTELE